MLLEQIIYEGGGEIPDKGKLALKPTKDMW